MKLPLLITAALLTATLDAKAAPAQQVIPAPAYDEAIIVPAGSPVRFHGFSKDGTEAKFTGQFVLTGSSYYGCDFGCEEASGTDADLSVMIIPDPSVAARLPRWKRHNNEMSIFVANQVPLGRALASREQRQALRAGKLDHLSGRVAVVVRDFTALLECDHADYSATFVRMSEPIASVRMASNSVAC